jgi:hypothetical protein
MPAPNRLSGLSVLLSKSAKRAKDEYVTAYPVRYADPGARMSDMTLAETLETLDKLTPQLRAAPELSGLEMTGTAYRPIPGASWPAQGQYGKPGLPAWAGHRGTLEFLREASAQAARSHPPTKSWYINDPEGQMIWAAEYHPDPRVREVLRNISAGTFRDSDWTSEAFKKAREDRKVDFSHSDNYRELFEP